MRKLYTKNPKKYKQLQPEERGQIEVYYSRTLSFLSKSSKGKRSGEHTSPMTTTTTL